MTSRVTVMAVALALAGCEPGLEWTDREGWESTGAVRAEAWAVAAVLQAADEERPCRDFRWGGWIFWDEGLFACGSVRAEGCYMFGAQRAEVRVVGSPLLPYAPYGALPHELAHYLLDRCGGSEGETPEHAELTRRIIARSLELDLGGR